MILTGCVSGSQTQGDFQCSYPLADSEANQARNAIQLTLPNGWTEIKKNETYYGRGLLTIFVFDSSNSTVEGCVDLVVAIAAQQSFIEGYYVNKYPLTGLL